MDNHECEMITTLAKKLMVRPRIPPKPRRTRETGVLRAVLTVLADGPYPVANIAEGPSGWDWPLRQLERYYTLRQMVAALAYGKRRGYVYIEESGLFWCITPAGRAARLGRPSRK